MASKHACRASMLAWMSETMPSRIPPSREGENLALIEGVVLNCPRNPRRVPNLPRWAAVAEPPPPDALLQSVDQRGGVDDDASQDRAEFDDGAVIGGVRAVRRRQRGRHGAQAIALLPLRDQRNRRHDR